MIGREDDADRRRDDVERRVGIVQRLAVGDLERQVEPELARLALRRLDQRRREIRAGDDRARAGGVERDVAGAAAEIEPVLAALRREALDQGDVHLRDDLGDPLERCGAPYLRVLRRQLLERHGTLPPLRRLEAGSIPSLPEDGQATRSGVHVTRVDTSDAR